MNPLIPVVTLWTWPSRMGQMCQHWMSLSSLLQCGTTFLLHLKRHLPVILLVTHVFLPLSNLSDTQWKIALGLGSFGDSNGTHWKVHCWCKLSSYFSPSVCRTCLNQDDQINLLPGLQMKREISSRPAGKWSMHGENRYWNFFLSCMVWRPT